MTTAPTSAASDTGGPLQALTEEVRRVEQELRQGGGAKAIERHKAKGKLTARERILGLIDSPESFMEFGLFTGDGMYAEQGGCPSGGKW